ncbi:MAG: dienelactone hydrolase family protein [Pseudomonadota bacterium]
MTLLKPNAEIPATDGTMGAYVSRPTGSVRAAVLMQVELWGMTLHMKEVADRLATKGYAAIVCDLFRGQEPPQPSDPVEKWAETFQAFDDVRATKDCRHALDWVLSGHAGFATDAVFAWGFCMGGRFAHNLGAFDTRLAGIINFYGRINFPRLATKPFLPIELTRMIDMPYLGVFAETDDLIPEADIDRLRADLSDNRHADIRIYPGTHHAFFNDHRDAYHADAAARAWTSTLAFLDAHS